MREQKGITIVPLIITIILLLILAVVTIKAVKDDGIISDAKSAAQEQEISNEKEILNLAILNSRLQNKENKITVENLNSILNEHNAEAFLEVDTVIIKFNDTGRYYEVGADGKVEHIEISEGKTKTLTVEFKDSAGTKLAEPATYTIFSNKYSIPLPQIEDYEPIEETLVGETTESTTITAIYYQIFDDDTELVFTGLNSSGEVTTVESDIVSYMVGNGTTTSRNGLKERTIKGVLKIPKKYKNKTITNIGQYAFHSCTNIFKELIIHDEMIIIGYASFVKAENIESLIIGKNVTNIESRAFQYTNLKTVTFRNYIVGDKGVRSAIFNGNNNFTEIRLEGNEDSYEVEDNVVYTKDGTTLLLYPTGRGEKVHIPNTVTKIRIWSFLW